MATGRKNFAGVRRNVMVARRNAGMSRRDFLKTTALGAVSLGTAAVWLSGAANAKGTPPHSNGAVVTINDPSYQYPFFIGYDPTPTPDSPVGLTAWVWVREGGSFEGTRLIDKGVDVFLPDVSHNADVLPGMAGISHLKGKDLPALVFAASLSDVLFALLSPTPPNGEPTLPNGNPLSSVLLAIGNTNAIVNSQLVGGPSSKEINLPFSPEPVKPVGRGSATIQGNLFHLLKQKEVRLNAVVAGFLYPNPLANGLPDQLNPNHLHIKLG